MSRKVLGTALLAASITFAAAPALASSYAVSSNQITNFSMWTTDGSISPFSFTFSNDAAALNNIGASNVNSMDASGACVGAACSGWQNLFTPHTGVLSAFSYGDALISSLPTVTGGLGAASAIGETRANAGIGYGTGGNTMMASFNVETAGTQLHFDFDANLIMQTILGASDLGAAASSAMQITINGPSSYQFLWTPNGATGGITGGSEVSDPFSLNQGIAGTDSFSAVSSSTGFHAMTAALAIGSYSMNISMNQTANVSAVPVPAAAWLFGTGLLGLVGVARRRAA